MLSWIFDRNPSKKLQRRYEAAMQEARDIQRRGDIVGYAAKIAEADALQRQLDEQAAVPGRTVLDSSRRSG